MLLINKMIKELIRKMVSDFAKLGDRVAADAVVDLKADEADFNDIQSAIDSLQSTGGSVYVRDGTYHIDSTIALYSNLRLLFSKGAELILDSDIIAVEMDNVENVEIIGLNLDLNNKNETNAGIRIANNSKNILLTKAQIKNGAQLGIGIYSSSFMNIERSYINNVEESAIYAEQSSHLIIENNKIENIQSGKGIEFSTVSQSKIINNFIENCGSDGIHLLSSDHIQVIGNHCKNNADNGIALKTNSSSNLISNNLCFDDQDTKTQKYGINIIDSSCSWNTVALNWLLQNLTAGFQDLGTNTGIGHNRI